MEKNVLERNNIECVHNTTMVTIQREVAEWEKCNQSYYEKHVFNGYFGLNFESISFEELILILFSRRWKLQMRDKNTLLILYKP